MVDMTPLAEELVAAYVRMSGWLLSEQTLQTALELITSLSMDSMTGAVGAGVTLVDSNGHRESAAATSDIVELADRLQYELDEGPCLTAAATGQVVRINDIETEGRWPKWRDAVSTLGLKSALSAPMIAGDITLGATKVYGRETNVFNETSESLLQRFGQQAAILLANAQTLERSQTMSRDLQEALVSRNNVAWATGVYMERYHVSQEQAMQRLMQAARDSQSELLDEAIKVLRSASSGSE